MFYGLKMLLTLIQSKVLKDLEFLDPSADAREREIVFFLQGQYEKEYLSTPSSYSFNSFYIKPRTDMNIAREKKAIELINIRKEISVREIDNY